MACDFDFYIEDYVVANMWDYLVVYICGSEYM